jgi:hypothetical protein
VRFNLPVLPEFIDRLYLKNLTLGASSVDLLLTRHGNDAAMTVVERRGDLRIIEVH